MVPCDNVGGLDALQSLRVQKIHRRASAWVCYILVILTRVTRIVLI